MQYRIDYTQDGKMHRLTRGKQWRKIALLCLGCVGIFLLILWTSGGDREVTEVALEQMVSQLEQGVSVNDVLTTFCLEILQGAQLG